MHASYLLLHFHIYSCKTPSHFHNPPACSTMFHFHKNMHACNVEHMQGLNVWGHHVRASTCRSTMYSTCVE